MNNSAKEEGEIRDLLSSMIGNIEEQKVEEERDFAYALELQKKEDILDFDEFLKINGIRRNLYLEDLASDNSLELMTLIQVFQPYISLVEKNPRVKNGENVHSLDSIFFSAPERLNASCDAATKIHLGEDNLTFSEISEQFAQFLRENPEFNYEYDKNKLTHEQLKGYLAQTLTAINTAYAPHKKIMEKMISQIWSCALNDPANMEAFVSAFSESYLTGGGCIQGLINRYAKCHTTIVHGILLNALQYKEIYQQWLGIMHS